MTIYGPDGSNNNPGLSLAAVAKQGYDFASWKLTEGDSFYDGTFEAARAEAEQAGLLFAAYHALHHGNAVGQADWFCQHLSDKSIPGMVDFEPFGDNPTRADAVAFVHRCHQHGVRISLDYLPWWYWTRLAVKLRSLKRLPRLVSSNYPDRRHVHGSVAYASAGGDKGPGWKRYGGRRPVLWQFTDNGLIDGYGGGVDINAFRGTRDELAALGLFKDYAKPAEKPKTHKHPKPKRPHRRWYWFPGFWPRWHKAHPHRTTPILKGGRK